MKRKLFMVLSVVLAASMLLAACTPPAAPTAVPPAPEPTAAPVEPTAPPAEPTAAPEPTAVPEPTKAPTTRKGGWLDEIVVSTIDNASVITQLEADAIDIYVNGMASTQFEELTASGLPYSATNGTYYTIQFNPAKFTDTAAAPNPFESRKIREAFNYMIDRNYINQEFYAGGALPKWFMIMTNFGDYADLAEKVRELETKYAFSLEAAKAIIDPEMEALGYTIEDGKYMFNGEQAKVVFLIRSDGDLTRQAWGNYLSDNMEQIGFAVERREGAGSDLSPVWIQSDPAEGQWHMYTGGWGASVLDRDQSNIFQEMFLNTSAQGIPVFLANVSDPEFQELGDRLARGDFKTLEERHEMMLRALELSLQDSLQVAVVDSKRFVPYREGVQVTADLAAGVEGAQIYPHTLRFADQEGGSMRWATQTFLFAGPWNPVAGSNTTSDQGVGRATWSYDFIYDPFTGLVHPMHAKSAVVTALTDLPIGTTLDWVTLERADEIVVPEDVWVDWDVEKQVFITNGEKNGTTPVNANIKTVVTYNDDVFDVPWHDGAKVSLADMVMGLIMTFERPNEKSAIYDEQAVGPYQVFLEGFRGVKIASTDPLTVEWYSMNYSTDAELTAHWYAFWPNYAFGQGSWDMMAMMNKAEADGKLAYTDYKAAETELEQTSLIAGPSLEILATALDELIEAKTIPFEPTLGQYVTEEEALARYEALKAWYAEKGHFWVGTGPYYLDTLDVTGKSLVLKHFDEYLDPSDRWDNYAAPKIADVEIEGPGQVTAGETATFDVYVTFDNQPYLNDDVKQVKYLVYDATNAVVAVADATPAEDGHYTIELTAEQTTALGDGANRLEVAVVPLVVAQPTFASVEFVSAK